MSALDGPRDPQDSSPLFAAFCTAFLVIEFFGYQGLPRVGFYFMTLGLSLSMMAIGFFLLVIPDAGSTGLTDKPDESTAVAEHDDDAFAAFEHLFVPAADNTFTPGTDAEVEMFGEWDDEFADGSDAQELARTVNSRAHGVKGWLL